jgi:hypothetical protein
MDKQIQTDISRWAMQLQFPLLNGLSQGWCQMVDTCVNCGNDDGPHAICSDCLELIGCDCFKGENLIDDVDGGNDE